MSYKIRQQKRQLRRHQKQARGANARIDRFLRAASPPGDVVTIGSGRHQADQTALGPRSQSLHGPVPAFEGGGEELCLKSFGQIDLDHDVLEEDVRGSQIDGQHC